MARNNYNAETKAAVLAALLEGQSAASIAEEYQIPRSTIRSWKSRQANGESVATVATENEKEHIGELLIAYLEDNLRTLRKQLVVFSDPDWLKKQNAADAAVLHGVMTDKAVRLLKALGNDADAAH